MFAVIFLWQDTGREKQQICLTDLFSGLNLASLSFTPYVRVSDCGILMPFAIIPGPLGACRQLWHPQYQSGISVGNGSEIVSMTTAQLPLFLFQMSGVQFQELLCIDFYNFILTLYTIRQMRVSDIQSYLMSLSRSRLTIQDLLSIL